MQSQYSPAQIARFWARVDKSGACWLWTAGKTKAGYGVFHPTGTTIVLTHRLAWELEHGPIPSGMEVCHSCDTPACVRHLFLATHAGNMGDMARKGRAATGAAHISRLMPWRVARGERHGSKTKPESRVRGERHHNAVLTTEKVRMIREMQRQGPVSAQAIATELGVTRSAIRQVLAGKTWKHVE